MHANADLLNIEIPRIASANLKFSRKEKVIDTLTFAYLENIMSKLYGPARK